MTTAVLDPGVAIAAAIRELVDSVRKVVSEDTEDPSVLGELSRLVGRARRRVNRAKKTAEPEPLPIVKAAAQPAPVGAAPVVPAAKASTSSDRSPAVTLTIPKSAPELRNEVATRSDPQPERTTRLPGRAHMSWPPQHHRRPPTRRPRRLPDWAWLMIVVIPITVVLGFVFFADEPKTGGGKDAAAEVACKEAIAEHFTTARGTPILEFGTPTITPLRPVKQRTSTPWPDPSTVSHAMASAARAGISTPANW